MIGKKLFIVQIRHRISKGDVYKRQVQYTPNIQYTAYNNINLKYKKQQETITTTNPTRYKIRKAKDGNNSLHETCTKSGNKTS